MERHTSVRSSASTARSKSTRTTDIILRSRTVRLAKVPIANAGPHILRLPNELLLMVCLHLKQPDVATFRLLHREVAAAAIEHIVSELIINLTESGFQKLEAVSEHPVISRYVTSILWEADCLPVLERDRWETMIQSQEQIAAGRARFVSETIPGDILGSEAQSEAMARYLVVPQHQYSKVQLDEAWNDYLAVRDGQAHLLESLTFLKRMVMALKRFPKLKHLTMSTGHAYSISDNSDAREYSAYGPNFSVLINGFGLESLCGVSQALCLLMGAYHAGTQLKTFECGSVNWRLLEQSHEVLAIMKRAVSNVKEMDLLFHFKMRGLLSTPVVSQAEVDKCTKCLGKGRLRDLVTSAPYLEALGMGFQWGLPSSPADLQNTVGPFHWPHLRSVYFQSIAATEDDMIDFLVRHTETLTVLRLYDLYLNEGEHLSIFRSMRSSLKLQVVDLRGCFASRTGACTWDFGYNEAKTSTLRLKVQNFILWQGDSASIDDLERR